VKSTPPTVIESQVGPKLRRVFANGEAKHSPHLYQIHPSHSPMHFPTRNNSLNDRKVEEFNHVFTLLI